MKICYLVFIKTWKIPWKGLLVIIFYGIFGNSKTGQIFYHLNLSTSWSHTETFFWLVTQFATLETKRELGPKCVPQLFLGSSLVTCRSAIGQFLSNSPRNLFESQLDPLSSFLKSRMSKERLHSSSLAIFYWLYLWKHPKERDQSSYPELERSWVNRFLNYWSF